MSHIDSTYVPVHETGVSGHSKDFFQEACNSHGDGYLLDPITMKLLQISRIRRTSLYKFRSPHLNAHKFLIYRVSPA